MKKLVALALTAGALLATAVQVQAARAQTASAGDFARLPAVEAPKISPDGTRIAHIEHNSDGDFLVIRNADDFSPISAVGTSTVKARGVLWADNDIVILIASEASSVYGVRGQVEFSSPFSIDLASGNKVLQLMQVDVVARTGSRLGTQISSSVFNPNKARIIGLEPSTGHLLIPDLDVNDFSLYSVDPRTDDRNEVGNGTPNTRDWVVDASGEPIARVDYRNRSDRFAVLVRDGNEWNVVVEETTEIPNMSVFGLNAEGDLIIGTRPSNVGRYGLYVLSLETGDLDHPYFVDELYDVAGVMQDPYKNLVIGAVVQAESQKTVWFDDELAARQAEIDQALGEGVAMLTSWSSDRKRFIVAADDGQQPPIYYLYDHAAASLRPIASAYPEAHASGIAPRLSILYPARDGVQIPAYLTMADGLPQPAPMVVLPHGGPEARDVGGFDWLAHFLASRGYVVVQPNFRGSEGYGSEWRDAGRGEWGTGVMQNDITDAVQLFIEEGIADPERVCIVGASYGGYAALAGAAFTPDLYACAAAIAPVADVNEMIAYERDRSERGSWVVAYWERVIGGDLGAARDRLDAISPARHADAITAPILLIHGRDDSVVPISQSRNMERVLERAGKTVELVELAGEDHGLSRAETRLQAMEALDRFLAENLSE
jgi:dipeptidyl aminopeptidase/acylaminoacyl peptidase